MAVASWIAPDGMTADVHAWEARPGGAVHVTLRYDERSLRNPGKTTDRTDVGGGRFVEAREGERVVLEVDFEADAPRLAGTLAMTWSLHGSSGGTRVSFVAEDVPPGIDREPRGGLALDARASRRPRRARSRGVRVTVARYARSA